ncbi:LysE family translocator [Actinocatenispora rupis]|uniref:Lysine transporter LysE n=1 Tax=Actinocatenispora rupis TaxID=519421 RepID=A0A8J3JCG3_9ACTN|nr:LysE family translocator [Actinocatenispora rupis]GID15902.1 lysine transporter LysE [Actinocatenispora rupis]
MTVLSAVGSFAVVAGLLTLTPGLDTALVLRAALREGRARAFATALGVGTGALLWGVAAAVGVSALLTASHLAYLVLRYAGAAYLGWLGGKMLWSSFRTPAADTVPPPATGGAGRAYARGVLTNLLNPKVGVFYIALLPQFLPPHTAHLPMGLLLAAVHDAEGMVWFTVLICVARLARRVLDRVAVRRWIDRVTGTVLVAFGVRLAVER